MSDLLRATERTILNNLSPTDSPVYRKGIIVDDFHKLERI
jgi:hypothetical protein